MRIALAVFGALVFLASALLSFYLLWVGKFSGTEFTAFVVSFAVLSLAVGFAPEIQEVSIAGNVVKLKEVKAEAIRAIESLNKSRVETLRVLFGLALKTEGGFANEAEIDPRIPGFWRLIDLATEYKCLDELKAEVLLGVAVLLRGQLSVIYQRSTSPELRAAYSLGETPEPVELASVALEPVGIKEYADSRKKSFDEIRGEMKVALDQYFKLFELKKKVEA
ncbi:hypothetical protein WLF14_14030 [Pseudomonas fluorescens]|uniref:hypothetical protein n=1 Tax=Pseudomonas fluorescens TaxID=294 RepID=UPI00313B0052